MEIEELETVTDKQKQQLDPTAWLDAQGEYLYRYALVRVRDAAIAEDLVQETLLAAIASYHSHAGRSSERTWLVGIMKHKVVDYFRRVARTSQFPLLNDDDDKAEWFENSGRWKGHWREDQAPLNWPINAAQILESREFWDTFQRCLSQLPEPLAIAFTLREIDGLSSNEICEILRVTPCNLWVMLHRARAKLRHLLEAEWFRNCTPAPHAKDKRVKSQPAEIASSSHLSYRSAAA